MKAIIIDDSEFDQLLLTRLVESHNELQLKGVFSNPIEAVSVLASLNPDLIFLDVEMPGMTGIEFLSAIKEVPQIIMVTSHKEYALDAFENDVTDFLVKPVEASRFSKAVEKALQINEWVSLKTDEAHIFVKVDGENVRITLSEVLYIEAMADYVKIITAEEKYVVLSTMKAISTKLPEDFFVRVHRSYIVNINAVTTVSTAELSINNETIPISRNGKRELKSALNK